MSVERYPYKGFTIVVNHDEDPQNPREDCDNLTVMACFHKRYLLGDKDHGFKFTDYDGWDEMEAAIIDQEDPAVIMPLFLYDHSGITIRTSSFNDSWDSGQVGFVWITKKAAKDNWSWKRITKARLEQVKKYILADVENYDNFITGAVYETTIENPDGEEVEDTRTGGWFGFDSIKNDGEAVLEAKATVDRLAEEWTIQKDREALPENHSRQMALPTMENT